MQTRPNTWTLGASMLTLALAAWAVGGCANGSGLANDAGRMPEAALGVCDEGTRCGATCVDVRSDPEHCGGCGRTCVVPHAEAVCAAGACAVGRCAPGFLDCNGSADDGCEASASCDTGVSCTTSCGTTGSLRCDDACAPSCAPPAEICNLADDDCDGACESGLPGCRVAVHRSSGPSGHFYTTNRGEAACCSMTVEAYDFFFLSSVPVDGTQPFFRCLAGGGYHLYTTDTGCEMALGEGQMGYIARTPLCGAVPLYRLFHPSGDHFYTTSAPERDSAFGLGYQDRGIIGYVWLTP